MRVCACARVERVLEIEGGLHSKERRKTKTIKELLTLGSSGHSGRFGHEFLEFDIRVVGDGRSAVARYANNSNYRNDSLIRKEMCVSDTVVDEVRRIVRTSEIMKEDDAKWPQKNKDGRQELEIRIGGEHISFEVRFVGLLRLFPFCPLFMCRGKGMCWLRWRFANDGKTNKINRRPRSAPLSTSPSRPTPRACASSTTSSRTSRPSSSA